MGKARLLGQYRKFTPNYEEDFIWRAFLEMEEKENDSE